MQCTICQIMKNKLPKIINLLYYVLFYLVFKTELYFICFKTLRKCNKKVYCSTKICTLGRLKYNT